MTQSVPGATAMTQSVPVGDRYDSVSAGGRPL